MALTADRNLDFYASQELIDLPVDDNVRIYKGALVGRNRSTGYVRPLVARDEFVGVAYGRADNTGPGHTAGGVRVRLHQHVDIVHPLAGVTNADVGKDVYAGADDTLTLTPADASRVGRIVAVEGTGLAACRISGRGIDLQLDENEENPPPVVGGRHIERAKTLGGRTILN